MKIDTSTNLIILTVGVTFLGCHLSSVAAQTTPKEIQEYLEKRERYRLGSIEAIQQKLKVTRKHLAAARRGKVSHNPNVQYGEYSFSTDKPNQRVYRFVGESAKRKAIEDLKQEIKDIGTALTATRKLGIEEFVPKLSLADGVGAIGALPSQQFEPCLIKRGKALRSDSRRKEAVFFSSTDLLDSKNKDLVYSIKSKTTCTVTQQEALVAKKLSESLINRRQQLIRNKWIADAKKLRSETAVQLAKQRKLPEVGNFIHLVPRVNGEGRFDKNSFEPVSTEDGTFCVQHKSGKWRMTFRDINSVDEIPGQALTVVGKTLVDIPDYESQLIVIETFDLGKYEKKRVDGGR